MTTRKPRRDERTKGGVRTELRTSERSSAAMNQRRHSAHRPLRSQAALRAVPAVSPLSPAIPIPSQPFALRQIRRSTFRPDPAQLPHPPPHALILTGLQTAYPAAHQHRRRPQQNSDIHLAQTRGSLQPPGRGPARQISPLPLRPTLVAVVLSPRRPRCMPVRCRFETVPAIDS